MGIGGISMSGLARHYQAEGYTVSVCDADDSPTVTQLREVGIEVHIGHDPAHLNGVNTLVSTMAVPNPVIPGSVEEVKAALEQGIRSLKRVELLGQLFRERNAIGVTGCHGRGGSTGMLATIWVKLADNRSVQRGADTPLIRHNRRH